MPKIGGIELDDCILDALRDDRLVVFAGAGVSMGAPSNLPSFDTLARDIAAGTGIALTKGEPIDRFLGRLQHQKVAVHVRASQRLAPDGSEPNFLHTDLLRLFRSADRVRLVTTNFDLHFERAAESLFGQVVDIFRAPALPLGNRFRGIVHVHGAVSHSHDMVLTDVDFGRAYLTEGWARRFLVEAFRSFTVLFVGYSHTDIVMNYLARALPADSVAGRFALTEEDGFWNLLNIKPIRFNKGNGVNAYQELYGCIRQLADRSSRGALDWQSRIGEIGRGVPPVDEEAVGEVEQALREVHTTRFLINVATTPGWPQWLDARKQLNTLFGSSLLCERDRHLAWWLAEHYVNEPADELFELIAAHGMRLNPELWRAIGHRIGARKDTPLGANLLKRWVTILLTSAPDNADPHTLLWLAQRCDEQGAFSLTLKVFLFMGKHRLNIKPGFAWSGQLEESRGHRLDVNCPLLADHWTLNEVWTKCVRPRLESIALSVLSGTTLQLQEIHCDLLAWNRTSREWDGLSYGRAAIEPHAQDKYRNPIDVVIDAARDASEWLAANNPTMLNGWIEMQVVSDVPLLRRLAIHAMAEHPGKSGDERLTWLLNRVDLFSSAEHHEIYRAAALAYRSSSHSVRQETVQALLNYRSRDDDPELADELTSRARFNWLEWLHDADPSCSFVNDALTPIRATNPNWRASEHPDLTHWTTSGWLGSRTPWAADELLTNFPSDRLDDLLNFEGNHFDGPDRSGLITAVRDACKQRISWALDLGRALSSRSLWGSDLWPATLSGCQEAAVSADDWRSTLEIVATPELQSSHAHAVANVIYALVRDGGKPFSTDLLDQANSIALSTWRSLKSSGNEDEVNGWLLRAINRPAGLIIEFWMSSLSLLMHGTSGSDRCLPDDYEQWFTMVVDDATHNGGLGRSLLASQISFFFGLSEVWTRKHLLPLFTAEDQDMFAQAWDGFLTWGQLNAALADAMFPAFVAAIARLGDDLEERRARFIEFLTILAVFHVDDPTQQLLPALFLQGSVKDRIIFASHLCHILRNMQPNTCQALCERWLLRYWGNRLQAVPSALSDDETRSMLDWLPYLGEGFPAAVSMAIRSPLVGIEHLHVLYELKQSELVTRYPAETAELLIHICSVDAGYHAPDIKEVAGRLSALPAILNRRLHDAMAHAGVI